MIVKLISICVSLLVSANIYAATTYSWQERDYDKTRKTITDNVNGKIQIENSTLKHLQFTVTESNGETWTMKFDAPNHENFHTGVYRRVTEYAIDNHAGMAITQYATISSGRSFEIRDIQADASGQITSAAIDFLWSGTPNYGAIRYLSGVPDDVSAYAANVKKHSIVLEYEAPGGWPYLQSSRNDDYYPWLSMDGRRLTLLVRPGAWSIDLTAPLGSQLEVGKLYDKTSLYPNSDYAQMFINAHTRGRFIIRELELNKYYEVVKLAADFEYSYFDSMPPRLVEIHGYTAVRYNSDFPINIAPVSVYDEKNKLITIPFVVNAIGFPYQYFPVKVTMELLDNKPMTLRIIDITPVNPADFYMQAPGGIPSPNNLYWARFVIPRISSQALLGDNNDYELILDKTNNKDIEIKVGDMFTFYEKHLLK